jgi:argininosuccinate lyase
VTEARSAGWLPKTFPYAEAQRIYREVTKELLGEAQNLPLTDAAFRESLTPEYVVRTRGGIGAPAPETCRAGLAKAEARLTEDAAWLAAKRRQLADAQASLDAAFEKWLS